LPWFNTGILWLELAANLRLYYAAALLLLLVVLLVRWEKKLLLATFLLLSMNLAELVSLYVPARPIPEGATKPLSIVNINLWSANPYYRPVIEYIQQKQADVVVLEELDGQWMDDLEPVFNEYPYRKLAPRMGNFGIGILSKKPILQASVKDIAGVTLPTIHCTIEHEDEWIDLIATHAPPPIDEQHWQWKQVHTDSLIAQGSNLLNPIVLVGDLNMTSFTPGFRKVNKALNLRDSRVGFGLQPTWNVKNYLMHFAIDHCLVSERIAVVSRETGPDVGSDHYPVYIEVSILPIPPLDKDP